LAEQAPIGSTLSFHRSLYLETALRSAVEAFSSFATIALTEEPGQWLVSISEPKKHSLDILCDEFANYALSETATHQPGSIE
jgi:hypothetical protein